MRPFLVHISILVCFLAASTPAVAQHSIHAQVVDAQTLTPLSGVNITLIGTLHGGITNAQGFVFLNDLPAGTFTLRFSYVGFESVEANLTLPLADPAAVWVVRMNEVSLELGEAVVTATRSSRTIADLPTRVETIASEEIEEKMAMDPSGIQIVLNESPGIVVQQTSAVSAAATLRIQGLDGRYTQLLRDGFPLYGGLSGGLSILQIQPLDLAQVEIIKGPSSTLYGGDAIAGLINLVTRKPTDKRETTLLLNSTTAGGLDASAYSGQRAKQYGYTVLASGNVQRAYDAEGDAFTNLPATRRLTLTPTLYRYGVGTTSLGLSAAFEVREGGDLDALRDDQPGYVERNVSSRISGFAGYERMLNPQTRFTMRSSGSLFRRAVEVPGFRFFGHHISSYSEASIVQKQGRRDLVYGLDFRTDSFTQYDGEPNSIDYAYSSVGVFVQDTRPLVSRMTLESGARMDAHHPAGLFLLPRISLLYQPLEGLSMRVGGGAGYKAPTPFLEEAEARAFRGVRPLGEDVLAERSWGANLDVNYRILWNSLVFTMNQAVYLTRITRPLLPQEDLDTLRLVTSEGYLQSQGAETTARLDIGDFKLFLGYVYVHGDRVQPPSSSHFLLTARHRTYTVIMWEKHERGRIGVEAYYTGPQDLPMEDKSPGFWVTGVMGQWHIGPAVVFANFENFLDTRQSRTSALVTGSRDAPSFAVIWGPTDGFIANAGIRVNL